MQSLTARSRTIQRPRLAIAESGAIDLLSVFYFFICHGLLACCRAAVRWLCGLAVRRHGQQALVR